MNDLIAPGSAAGVIRVALVEDDPDQREALLRLLRGQPDFGVLEGLSSADQAISLLPGLRPDVVLVDLVLPRQSGIEVVADLKERLPQARFLMLTVVERAEQVFAALSAGACGYLLKKNARERLGAAVREAYAGGLPFSVPVARLVLARLREKQPIADPSGLTPREGEVLDALAQGWTYKEVADHLRIALGTVQTHVEHIYGKLHVRSRLEALRKTGRS